MPALLFCFDKVYSNLPVWTETWGQMSWVPREERVDKATQNWASNSTPNWAELLNWVQACRENWEGREECQPCCFVLTSSAMFAKGVPRQNSSCSFHASNHHNACYNLHSLVSSPLICNINKQPSQQILLKVFFFFLHFLLHWLRSLWKYSKAKALFLS